MRAMDIRLYGLLLIFAIVGSNADLYSSAYGRHRRDVERSIDRYELEDYDLVKIIKRAADSKETDDKISTESSEEKTILTTKSPGTTSPSTKSPGTTSPSTTSPSTTKTTSSKPKSTKPTSTTSNAISPKPTTKSVPTSTETTTKPSTETTSKPQLGSRSAFDTKDDSPSNPTDSDEKADKKPSALSPRMKADTSDNKDKSPSSPLTGSNPNGPSSNPGYSQPSNYPFPGINSIPPYGPNYAFTSTNHGPGMASASASSFASAGASSSSNPSNPPFNSYGSFNNPYYNPNEYAWPAYDASQNNPVKPMTSSRSYFATDDKPKSPNNPATGNNGNPVNNPNSIPFSGPQNFPSRSFGGPYSPNFNYPPANGIQGPNYAWTDSGPGYAGASAGASYGSGLPMLNNRGAFSDNNAGTAFPDNSPYSPDVVAGGFQPGFDSGFDNGFSFHRRMMEDHFRRIQAQIEAQQRAIFDANNRIGGSSGFGPGSSEPGVHSAISSISVGPDGGFQAGQISPVAPGIESRFANPLPAPSGGSYGVFSSSRSVSSTDDTGRTVAHKSATTGVNDNGRITFRTVQD
ncbi:hypothetical protein M0802_009190 [Mischocyttarus mexicanus]|nr:hypothetical protein M0802_009190 [Mischocyttarus mexicanus]